MILTDVLKNIARTYYPSNIDSINQYEAYLSSNQIKRLDELKKKMFYVDSVQKTIDNIIKVSKEYHYLSNITNVTSNNFDRCISLKIDIKDKEFLHQLYVRISLLAPYFCTYIMTNTIQNEPYKWLDLPKRDIEFEIKNADKIKDIQEIVKKETGFSLLKNPILDIIIGDLSYEDIPFGDFSIYNAFFTNDNIA